MKKQLILLASIFIIFSLQAQTELYRLIDEQADAIESKVIKWRHHLHENPELSNREFETARYIEGHLRDLGLEVQTGIAHTGLIGILNTGTPGPVIGLRADMDALPVSERVDVPYASKVRTTYLGKETGVMHACGHDTHVAMLMGAAEVLTNLKDQLKGTLVFIFQPAEEGAPPGEEGGAALMVKEGLLTQTGIDVVFGMHINSQTEVGTVRFKPGGALAASDRLEIRVKGKQTHGSQPWGGIDPVTVSAQIILGLQNIISRQTELTKEAAVISIGKIQGGVRNNIIPEEVEMIGTIRTLDTAMQQKIHDNIRKVATSIAQAYGAEAEVDIQVGYPVTFNDPDLTSLMGPTLKRVAGEDNVVLSQAVTGAEDFSFFAREVPGLFLFLGGMPKGMNPREAAPHHTPDFFIDDSGMKLGVRLFCNMVVDYQE